MKTGAHTKTCPHILIENILVIMTKWKEPNYSSTVPPGQWDRDPVLRVEASGPLASDVPGMLTP